MGGREGSTREVLWRPSVIYMGGVYVLLYTLPLAWGRPLGDGFGEEGHELCCGAALVEGEGREVIRGGQDDTRPGGGHVHD